MRELRSIDRVILCLREFALKFWKEEGMLRLWGLS